MEFIIPAKYYSFSDFVDPGGRESGGDSGKLLVAERKPGVEESCPEKLLIKHRFSNDPCNEFMASRIAESLGVPSPRTYLISCPDWKKKGFRSRFICGIEYIDGLRGMTQEEVHSDAGGVFIVRAYALSVLLNQADQISLGMVGDVGTSEGRFYAYDFAETFMLANFYTDALLGNSVVSRRDVWLRLKESLSRLNAERSLLPELRLSWSKVLSITGEEKEDEKWAAFMKAVRKFPEVVTDERIEVLTETIRKYYGGGDGEVDFYKVKAADVLAWYYKEYLVRFREMCAEEMVTEIKNKGG